MFRQCNSPMIRINKEESNVITDISQMADYIVNYIAAGVNSIQQKIDKDFLYILYDEAVENLKSEQDLKKDICEKMTGSNTCGIVFESVMSKIKDTEKFSTDRIEKHMDLVMTSLKNQKNLNPEGSLSTNPKWLVIEKELKKSVENWLIREAETDKTLRIKLPQRAFFSWDFKPTIQTLLIGLGIVLLMSTMYLHHKRTKRFSEAKKEILKEQQ